MNTLDIPKPMMVPCSLFAHLSDKLSKHKNFVSQAVCPGKSFSGSFKPHLGDKPTSVNNTLHAECMFSFMTFVNRYDGKTRDIHVVLDRKISKQSVKPKRFYHPLWIQLLFVGT